jgi:hypothetical protein
MRDNAWLKNKLDLLWSQYFSDIKKKNEVVIKFGRKARTRLGSIKLIQNAKVKTQKYDGHPMARLNNNSTITLTGFFQDERVPEYIIDLTIAHELCHYAHGFSSPLPQLSEYPHQGGIVDSELAKRGFGPQLQAQKKWLKTEWIKIVGHSVRRRRVRRRRRISLFQFLISN